MKKRTLTFMVSAAMLAMVLAGCGNSSSTSSSAAGTAETTGTEGAASEAAAAAGSTSGTTADTITIGKTAAFTSLDPVMVAYTADIQIINMVCEQLVTTNDEGTEIVPGLATDWTISDDGLTYTFNLTPGLKFSDGTDVTAEDWQFSFDRAMTTEESPWGFAASNIDKVEVTDGQVIITLKTAAANTLSNLSCFSVSLQSKAQYDATNGYADAGSYPIGTGSYAISEWEQDNHLTLTANSYFHGDVPKTNTIKFVQADDDNALIMMLKAGEVDIVTDLPYANMSDVDGTDGLTAVGLPSTGNKYIILNETSNEALANKEVRQALLYATDKQLIVDMALQGYGEPAVSYMPVNGLYYDSSIEAVGYDVEKATELLSEAGYADGLDLEILVPSGNDTYTSIATILKDSWSKAGINLTITSMDSAALYDEEYAMNHEVLFGSWSDDIADPSQLGDYWWNYDSSQCFFTGYNNTDAQALFDQSNYELDETAREAIYDQLQQIWYDDVVAINMYHAEATVAYADSIQGYVQTPLYAYRFDNLVKVTE